MSEEKLYAVKNDEGEYWDFYYSGFWRRAIPGCYAKNSKIWAEIVADEQGGHVVSLTEEPKKVVVTKEQAEIVEEAYDSNYPASYIAGSSDDEKLIMNAYVNGWTVEKEKKYNVKVPHTSLYYWKKLDGGLSINDLVADDKYDAMKFTEAEIEHYGLQDCEKVECDNDEQ